MDPDRSGGERSNSRWRTSTQNHHQSHNSSRNRRRDDAYSDAPPPHSTVATATTRRRHETSVQLRKQRHEELLRRKRGMLPTSAVVAPTTTTNTTNTNTNVLTLPEALHNLLSSSSLSLSEEDESVKANIHLYSNFQVALAADPRVSASFLQTLLKEKEAQCRQLVTLIQNHLQQIIASSSSSSASARALALLNLLLEITSAVKSDKSTEYDPDTY